MSKNKKAVIVILLLSLCILSVFAIYQAFAFFLQMNYPKKYAEEVSQYAQMYQVDEHLIYSIIRTESGFEPSAASSAGAIGLMQMTEETFVWLKGKIAPEEALVFEDLYTPETAIRFGVYYISLCLEKYAGDISTAAAAYHSGWGTVNKLLGDTKYSANGTTLQAFPFEQMNRYVLKVLKSYGQYNKIYS
ncbi:MAG: lytic transglycosylase domain-containing protein [Oscillospiraceae bacterium]|nr:lytic transglycosylase domain-containing protein [Oscillospiraceae bacterium]